jgi:predicted secreted protein
MSSELPLNEQQQSRVCAILALGGTRRMAVEYAGCTKAQVQAERQKNPFFAERLRLSELRPEIELLRTMFQAATDPKQWRAATWTLERFYPRRYGKQRRDEISSKDLVSFIKRIEAVLEQEIADHATRRKIIEQLQYS